MLAMLTTAFDALRKTRMLRRSNSSRPSGSGAFAEGDAGGGGAAGVSGPAPEQAVKTKTAEEAARRIRRITVRVS
jgi:hypothetical protein